jgi:chemotaxis protein histidine kinase CheA
MVKTLLNLFKKPKAGAELLTELDITRVVGGEANHPEQPAPVEHDDASADPIDAVETWKRNDLDLLQTTWQACCESPDDEGSAEAFRSALHNLHGASGAYGGGALTRLSGSLQDLLGKIENLQSEAALINLHVQACRATLFGNGDAAEDVADAVCQALEEQVRDRLFGY